MSLRSTLPLLLTALLSCASPTLVDIRHLDQAVDRWERRGFGDYTIEMRISCFCDPTLAEWSTVHVVDGQVAEVRETATNTPRAPESWNAWPTVEEVFDRIRATRRSEIYRAVDVEYDPTLGYPRTANFLEREGVADAGVAYELRNPQPQANVP